MPGPADQIRRVHAALTLRFRLNVRRLADRIRLNPTTVLQDGGDRLRVRIWHGGRLQ
jgi:hypothetical protein